MTAIPYHVRLSISQYGDRLKAELFTEDLGDTEGEFLPAEWKVMEEWAPYLSQGAAHLPPDSARTLGKELFNYLIGGVENSKKWIEILEQVKRQKRSLRLLIDAYTDSVRDLPYGLLCEPHDDYFLLRPSGNSQRPPIQFIRILRRCTPRLLNLNKKPLRILIIAAEPTSQENFSFNCASRLRELTSKLIPSFDVYMISPTGIQLLNQFLVNDDAVSDSLFESFCYASREIVKEVLVNNKFDILHIIAHGQDGDLLLCDGLKNAVSVTSGELSEWCSSNDHIQMAFLQVCEAGRTGGKGGFGGLAQQLINPRYGNLAAVIASSYPLDALGSTFAAIDFYDAISKGYDLDLALKRNLDERNWSWAFLELWVRPSALDGVTNRGAFQFVSPYRGLSRFEERNADIFFGRIVETSEILQLLESDSIVVIIGDTGSGKSSLLQAGVASNIRQKGLLDKNNWEIITVEPGGNLRERVITALKNTIKINLTESEEGDLSWQDFLIKLLNYKSTETSSLLLVIDQFEEVFTLKENDAELNQLCKILADFTVQHPNSFRLILSLRSEFLGTAITLLGLSKAVSRPWVLRPPGPNDLFEIIAEPAKQYGYTFETLREEKADGNNARLLDRILSDPILTRFTEKQARTEMGTLVNPLPLLEFALERLWLMAVERGTQEFKHEDYEKMEGLGGAIINHAEEIYSLLPSKFGESSQAIAEKIFTSLVSASGTRRPRARIELESLSNDNGLTRKVIDYLVGERLLAVRSHSENLSLSYVDLIHEVLIERWARFRNWLAENPELRALIEAFEIDSKRWIQGMRAFPLRTQNNLPSNSQAKKYILWIDATKQALSDEQQQFASALRKMLTRRKLILSGLIIFIFVAFIVAAFLWQQATDQQHIARINLARNLQQKATVAINDKDMLAAELFAAKALTIEDQPDEQLNLREKLLEARSKGAVLDSRVNLNDEFLDAILSNNLILTKTSEGDLKLFDSETQREVHTFQTNKTSITHAVISTDGRLLSYGTETGDIRVLRVADGSEINLPQNISDEQKKPISSLTFSDNNSLLAFGSESGIVKLLDLNNNVFKIFKGHSEPVHSLSFSSDSRRLASVSSDETVRLWDIASAKELPQSPFKGHEDTINSVAFSPDRAFIATGSADGTIRIWDTESGKELQIFTEQVGTVAAISFSPNGHFLATAGEDETIRIFDLSSYQEILKIKSFAGRVKKLLFTSDSRKLLAGCKFAVSIWTTTKDNEVTTLIADNGPMTSVAFSPDGKFLAGASRDSKIYIWDFKNKTLQKIFSAHEGVIYSLAYSNDSSILASGAEFLEESKNTDSPLKLWDVNNNYQQSSLVRHTNGVQGLAFSPTETILATAGSYDRTIELWNYQSKAFISEFSHEGGAVWNVAFSPDGQYIASAGGDKSVRLWNIKDKTMSILYKHEGEVWGISFSRTQPFLASGSVDKSVKVWNLKDNKEEYSFLGHVGTVVSTAFDPNGEWLASSSEDHTVRLWNLNNKQSLTLKIHERPVWWVSFSNDGLWLASCSLDKKIEVWNMKEINSIYNSNPNDLLSESKRKTGLNIEEDKILRGE